jgi:CBS domain-containing protein
MLSQTSVQKGASMLTTTKPLLAMTAADLMTETVVMISDELSLQGAAHTLAQARISGAPVVDRAGRCVGVLSSTDFLAWAEKGKRAAKRGAPFTSPFTYDWQLLEPDELPEDVVRNYMTADPVMISPLTRIGELAQMMLDAHIHRVIVVNPAREPIGIISSTDILAAVAYAERVDGFGLPLHQSGMD